ncbi:MAG: hypothetical protein Q9195_005781 [Heterodermia aff. obscurata]
MLTKVRSVVFPRQDRTFHIGCSEFLVHFSKQDVELPVHKNEPALVTVFEVPETDPLHISAEWVRSQMIRCRREDDVHQAEFLEGVVFSSVSKGLIELTQGAQELLGEAGAKWVHCFSSRPAGVRLCSGTYTLMGNRLCEVWKLYKDSNGTLLTALCPTQTNPLAQLYTYGGEGDCRLVAVSSRLRYRASRSLPLAGVRVVVKDNFHIAGLKTSLCNRAYYELYPPQETTAECIQTLIDAGASILGKAKLNSFGVWEEPTEYIDYQAPWNPRADGYQSPGGSSTGSGAAIAAYDWLDIGIGSDSKTAPNLATCFTADLTDSGGKHHETRMIDAPGFLGRDLGKFREFAAVWYADKLATCDRKVSRIIWATDYWETIDPEQRTLAERFAKDLEAFLGLDQTKVSFRDAWHSSRYTESGNISLEDYLKNVSLRRRGLTLVS